MQIFHLQHRKLNMIDYKTNYPISVKQFIELLNKTTLGARRPLEDEKRVTAMLYHADLLVTAWDGERLVGGHVP